jgi:predicted ATPase
VGLGSVAEPALVSQVLFSALTALDGRNPLDRLPLDALLDQLRTCPCASWPPAARTWASAVSASGLSPASPPPGPLAAHLLPLDELAQYEAVRLFVEHAQEVKRPFRLTAQNAAAVAHICLRLDGIPLATGRRTHAGADR